MTTLAAKPTESLYQSEALVRNPSSLARSRVSNPGSTETSAPTRCGAVDALIDRMLEWYAHPEHLEEDEIEPPTRQTIERALRFLVSHRDGLLAYRAQYESQVFQPVGATVGSAGSISLDWEFGPDVITLRLHDDGSGDCLFFRNSRLLLKVPAHI